MPVPRETNMIQFSRQWAISSKDTFDVPPINHFVKKYLRNSKVSIDPFARNKRWATYTNDLNTETVAEYHLDSAVFLELLVSMGVKADLIFFDPPYSPRQIKECYDGIGLKMGQEDAWRSQGWIRERRAIEKLIEMDGIVLSFGWNSNGMGRSFGFTILEILMVNHGWGHYDTICMAERKIAHQFEMDLA